MSNQITVLIEGKERTFHFGLNTWNQFIIMRNKRLKELDELKEGQELVIQDVSQHLVSNSKYFLEANQELMYCALVSFCKLNAKPIDFTVWQVGEWINEMEESQLLLIMETLQDSKYLGKTIRQWNQVAAEQPLVTVQDLAS